MGRHNRPVDTDHDPRHTDPDPARGKERRGRGGALAAFAAAFAILIGLGVTGWFVLRGDAFCLGQELRLEVAAAPELAPALTAAAENFEESNPSIDNRCVAVTVQEADPADVTYGITGLGPTAGDTDADVWIPDSSIWVHRIATEAEGETVAATGTLVANSPLVLASPSAAEDTEEEDASDSDLSSWQALVPTAPPTAESAGQGARLVDPARSSSGMVTIALINGAVQAQLNEEEAEPPEEEDALPANPRLIAALQNLQEGVATDESDAFAMLTGEEEDVLLPLAEQAVWRYNNEHTDTPAQVSYPEEGTYILDYPFVLRTEDGTRLRAAELLRNHLSGSETQEIIREHGFRSDDGALNPDLFDSELGFSEESPEALPTPGESTLATLTTAWNQLKLKTRMLTLLDISGSMLEEVPGTDATRMEVAAAAAAEGLQLFPDDAEIGLWEFSEDITPEGLDYRETHPMAELGEETEGATRREALGAQLAATEPLPTGGTGLYDTILAAYREMLTTYESDRVATILVLTDGEDNKEDGLELDELLAELEEESDPERPVQVIVISFGPDLDGDPMSQVVEVTGGSAHVTEDPTEIGDIFLEGFALRMAGAVAEAEEEQ